jgi:energy-converting hydrogenase B subunit D
VSLFTAIVLGALLVCAVSTSLTRDLLTSVVIYMAYSLIMSILWILLQSPDLAITEAAVGAGVTGILFFITLKKLHAIKVKNDEEKDR